MLRVRNLAGLPQPFLQALNAESNLVAIEQPASWTMSLALSLLLVGIIAACIGVLNPEGIWSNAIRLVNVITAALVAMSFYEPVAHYLTKQLDSYIVFWDFLAIWAVFSAAIIVGRTVTSSLSTVNVRFPKVIDRWGSGILAAWIGWVMVCFTVTTLHTAPLARNFFFASFQPKEAMFFGVLHPDREWLAFTQRMSTGAYSNGPGKSFDPQNAFVAEQANRRTAFEHYVAQARAVLINPQFATPGARPVPPPR
jgi:uncharacterized membrane protein required for colicin V production